MKRYNKKVRRVVKENMVLIIKNIESIRNKDVWRWRGLMEGYIG